MPSALLWDTKSLQEIQLQNEILFNRYNEGKRIKEYFSEEDKDLQRIIEKNQIDKKLAIELVSFMFFCDHANIDMLVGHMLRFFPDVQSCCDWISQAIDWDLVDYNGKSFMSCWTIPKAMKQELESYQFPLPMLVLPKWRKKNTDSAYMTQEHDSIFCGETFTPEDACLDCLAKQDSIGLKLNMTVVKLTKNQWKSLVGGQKPNETLEHYKEKLEQFNKYDKSARNLVEMFQNYTFYLVNKYDKRGRMYDQGYYIHSQGTDWNKGAIEFAHEELIED